LSRISLSGNASGTGTLTIAAPNTNTDRTLTLPDSTGAILNDQSNIEAQVKTATNATGSAPIYACRAWVNFNGQSTVSIRGSGNVTSITDNGTGNYTVNFTTAMPDANYAAIAARNIVGTSNGFTLEVASLLTTSCVVLTREVASVDPSIVSVSIFR
jgi:hypothetical protein